MGLAAWMMAGVPVAGPESTSVLVDGARMHGWVAGQGAPLILVHGLLGTAESWGGVMARLALESRVYAVDAIGVGQSDRLPGLDTSLRAQADRLIAFLDQQEIASADWVGTSHGGAVLLMLAAMYPERVRSLVLHAPVNPFCSESDFLIRFYGTGLGRWIAHRAPFFPAALQRYAMTRLYGDSQRMRRGSLDKYVASLRVPGTVPYVLDILTSWQEQMCELHSTLPALCEVPTLLLWGDRDQVVGQRSAEVLRGYLHEPQTAVLPGVGHLAYEEAPQAFAAAVSGFLRRTAPAADELENVAMLARDAA